MVLNEEGRRPVELTVVDPGGHLAGARGALPEEIRAHIPLIASDDLIAAVALDGLGREILVVWAGLGCDKAATLTVDPQANLVTIAPGPNTGCDLIQISRGVVLSFRNARDVASLGLDLRPTPVIEPS